MTAPILAFAAAPGRLAALFSATFAWALVLAACGDDGMGDPVPMDDAGPPDAGPSQPELLLPRTSITADEVAVLVAEGDPVSEALGAHYLEARGIPADQLYRLPITTGQNVLSAEDFAPIKADLDAALPDTVQALVITWTQPFRVACMSITSAFALGFDRDRYCNTTGMACGRTSPTGYAGSTSLRPFDDAGIRPAMMLPVRPADEETGRTDDDAIADGRALIDRGVAADDTFPMGDGYYMRTNDRARSGPRELAFSEMPARWAHDGGLQMFYRDQSAGDEVVLRETEDVLFYATGAVRVADIDTNTYLPGAVAEHLTSFGGQVPTSGQMSVLAWIEAGATASYGTVVEPCNFPQKFPDPHLLVDVYVRGSTVLEALWKSVVWPGEGLFVGEPLARPWGAQEARIEGDEVVFTTTALGPFDEAAIEGADSPDGPWRVLAGGFATARPRRLEMRAPLDGARYVRLTF